MDVRLRLPLAEGSFKLLLDDTDIVLTAFTDCNRTSRSSSCSSTELLAFAQAIVRHYAPKQRRKKV